MRENTSTINKFKKKMSFFSGRTREREREHSAKNYVYFQNRLSYFI